MPFDVNLLILLFFNALGVNLIARAAQFEPDDFPRIGAGGIATRGHIVPGSKMALWWLRYYGDKYLPWYITKPLYDCPLCMGGLHSIYPYFITYGFSMESLIQWTIYFPAVCFASWWLDNH